MSSMIVGLVCMCFMRFARTQEDNGPEGLKDGKQSFREISSVESDIGQFLFQAMDMEIERNRIVTLTEYITFWTRADSNNDKRISTQEVNIFLEEHMVGPSSNAEQIFGETDLTDSFSLKITFKLFDTNNDDVLRSDEFFSAYTTIGNTS